MKLLMYCVLSAGAAKSFIGKKGVQDQNTKLVSHEDIAVAVSPFDPAISSLDIQTLMVYHDIIGYCFNLGTVIPFRFKTILRDEAEVRRHLEQRGTDYESTLRRLNGKTEMGMRLILDKIPIVDSVVEGTPDHDVNTENPGMSYLFKRRKIYGQQMATDSRCQESIEAAKKVLEGLYVDLKVESSPKAGSGSRENEILISIYFLVERESVDRFRTVTEENKSILGGRVLISGPWAPYNFV